MDLVITPEPHLIPGYTGHCQQLRFRAGKTYGNLSHKLFIDPCAKHAPELIVTKPTQPSLSSSPTEREVKTLIDRLYFIDPVYRYPIIPGYDGFVPNMAKNTGKRFMAAATAGVAEHERLIELLRCEKRLLERREVLESGAGKFDAKLRERMLAGTVYRSPLIPVKPRCRAFKFDKPGVVEKEKIPYSKFTVPHFMENDNVEKYIVNGYDGHVPMAMTRFGQSSKQLTNSALVEFTNNYHHRKSEEWCPMEMTGVASSAPKKGEEQFIVYHRTTGLIPLYAGHVPGEIFSFGRTYGNATVDARNWLARHKE